MPKRKFQKIKNEEGGRKKQKRGRKKRREDATYSLVDKRNATFEKFYKVHESDLVFDELSVCVSICLSVSVRPSVEICLFVCLSVCLDQYVAAVWCGFMSSFAVFV
jgi:hypothetical protein